MANRRATTDTATTIEPSDDDAKTPVPEAIGDALAALTGGETRPTRLGGFLELAGADVFSPDAASVDDLLVTDDDSRHEVGLDDRAVNTYCFLDALVLALLEDDPVDITTRPPGSDETIELTASREGIQGGHDEMVVSFGFSDELPRDPDAYADKTTEEIRATTHALGCPMINLFPDREAYDAWIQEADAVAMPLGLPEALALARDTVDAWDR